MDAKEQRRLSGQFVAPSFAQTTPLRMAAQNIWEFLVPAATTLLVFLVAFYIAAHNQHPLLRIKPSPSAMEIRSYVPLLVGVVAVLAIHRPLLGLAAVLALTPVWNSAMVSFQFEALQIILQTVFAVALVAGCAVEAHRRRSLSVLQRRPLAYPLWDDDPAPGRPFRTSAAPRRLFSGLEASTFAELAAVAFVGFAIASTYASLNPGNSVNGLLHGIVEPAVFGAVLVYLRPSPRDLMLIAGALAISIALASGMDLLQNLWAWGTNFNGIISHRLDFTQVTYNNVGLFGVIIAAVLPMLASVVLLRREARVPDWAIGVLALAAALSLAGLFFTVSKSAWLASAGALTILLLLVMHTWWKRLTMSLAVIALSAVFIPWPALVFQAVPGVDTAYRKAIVAMVGESRFDSWNPTTAAGHGSMAERYYAVEGGIDMAIDHPVFGVGLDEFHTYYMTLGYRPAQAKDDLDHAHSVFPEVAAELGFPALAMLLTLLAAALLAMWRVYRAAHDNVSRTMAAMLIASIIAWVVAGTAYGADIYRSMRDQASDIVVLAIVLAMAVALARWARGVPGVPGMEALVRERTARRYLGRRHPNE